MKVFISWSGNLSKDCAEFLKDWIKCTLQASDPWISTQDIDKGQLWFNDISNALSDTNVGIVCLTKSNKANPWILFEAGALAKGLSSSKVITFLINLKPSDIEPPLAQFHHTTPSRDDLQKLISSINNSLGDNKLIERVLTDVFNTYWPKFDEGFKRILESHAETSEEVAVRTSEEIQDEILNTIRAMNTRLFNLENKSHYYPDRSILYAAYPTLLDPRYAAGIAYPTNLARTTQEELSPWTMVTLDNKCKEEEKEE
jgi:hypothetical protein